MAQPVFCPAIVRFSSDSPVRTRAPCLCDYADSSPDGSGKGSPPFYSLLNPVGLPLFITAHVVFNQVEDMQTTARGVVRPGLIMIKPCALPLWPCQGIGPRQLTPYRVSLATRTRQRRTPERSGILLSEVQPL